MHGFSGKLVIMRNKTILYSTLLCLYSLTLLSAAPPTDKVAGKDRQHVEETESREKKPTWVDRSFGRDRDDTAEEEAERRREEAEERAEEAWNLPEKILNRLPETTDGTEILQIGDEVIRVMENSREIIDILGIGQNRAED